MTRPKVLASVGVYLTGELLESMPDDVRAAAVSANESGAVPLARIIRQLPGHRRRKALRAAQTIVNEEFDYSVLSTVPEAALDHTVISAGPARAASADALAVACAVRRAEVLAVTMPPSAVPDDHEAGHQVIASWLRKAVKIDSFRIRGHLLALVGPLLEALPQFMLRDLWRESRPILAARSRPDLMIDIGNLAPLLPILGGANAVREALTAIEDVNRWWP